MIADLLRWIFRPLFKAELSAKHAEGWGAGYKQASHHAELLTKMKAIRCKQPTDILVVKEWKDFDAIARAMPMPGGCLHPHPIVCGDMWFTRDRGQLFGQIKSKETK